MKVLVIGATGHVGTYLVPRLVRAGHEVTAISRGLREPYTPDPAWQQVKKTEVDRVAADSRGNFGETVARTGAEVVIDLILFHPDSVPQLLDSLSGKIRQFVYCGTMWVYGPTRLAPTTENEPRKAEDTYGREKGEIEQIFADAARDGTFPACTLHPGHIVGTGWPPINPAGNLNLMVWEKLGRGEELVLPNDGLAMLHHVHADDVAQGIQLAVENPDKALGESFNIVSPQAVTLSAFSQEVASWFGREAVLAFREWSKWREYESREDIDATWEHLRNSPCGSIEKARRVLGYEPAYTTFAAIREALAWLIEQGQVDLPRMP